MSRYDSFCNMPLSQGVYRCYTSNWMQIVKCDFIEVLLKRFHELPYQDHYECSIALLQSVSAADHSESCKRANASRTEVRVESLKWVGNGGVTCFNPKLWLSHSENHDCITRILIHWNGWNSPHAGDFAQLAIPVSHVCLSPRPGSSARCFSGCLEPRWPNAIAITTIENKLSSLPQLCQTLPPAKWLWRTTSNANIQKEWKSGRIHRNLFS